METIVLNAIMNRYESLNLLYESMRECEDTVLMNLSDDINDVYNEDEILKMISITIN